MKQSAVLIIKKDLQEGDFDSYDEPVADIEGNRESTVVPSGQNAASAKNSFEETKPFTPQELLAACEWL